MVKISDRKLNEHQKQVVKDLFYQGLGLSKCPKCGKTASEAKDVCPITQTKRKGSIEVGQFFGIRVYAACKKK